MLHERYRNFPAEFRVTAFVLTALNTTVFLSDSICSTSNKTMRRGKSSRKGKVEASHRKAIDPASDHRSSGLKVNAGKFALIIDVNPWH